MNLGVHLGAGVVVAAASQTNLFSVVFNLQLLCFCPSAMHDARIQRVPGSAVSVGGTGWGEGGEVLCRGSG